MNVTASIKFDPSLARGLDYYTGMIFEAILVGEDSDSGLGSIAGGGRYDNLIGQFSKNKIPSTGGSVGIERIFNIIEEKHKKNQEPISTCDVMIGQIGNVDTIETLKVANWVWEKTDMKTEFPYTKLGMKETMGYALKRNSKYLVFLSEKELAEGKLLVKNLKTKVQEEVDFSADSLIEYL